MSLKKKAAQVRAAGYKNSRQDSMLAHITPEEAAFLKRGGGSGRKDPKTGLPHYEGFGDSDSGGFSDGGGFTGGYGDPGGGYGMSSTDVGPPNAAGALDVGNQFANDFSGYNTGSLADTNYGYNDLAMGPPEAAAAQDLGNQFASGISGYNTGSVPSETTFLNENNLRKGLGMLSGMFGPIGSLGVRSGLAATSKDPGQGFGSMAGGMIGGLLAGPLGAMAGSKLGGGALSGMGASSADAAAGIAAGRAAGGSEGYNTPGFDLGGTLTGLAGLYQGNQAAKSTNQAANVAQQQTQQLADLYGPNSPYAAQLRQQLERKDAAAGRRSQYGPREVELQARLADVASRNAPNVLAANQAAQGFRQQGQTTRGQQLAGALSLANKTGLTGMAQRGLQGLWSGAGGGTTGNEGFSLGGMSFNNPSAYVAPETAFEWPSAQGAYDFASEVGSGASSFWD